MVLLVDYGHGTTTIDVNKSGGRTKNISPRSLVLINEGYFVSKLSNFMFISIEKCTTDPKMTDNSEERSKLTIVFVKKRKEALSI